MVLCVYSGALFLARNIDIASYLRSPTLNAGHHRCEQKITQDCSWHCVSRRTESTNNCKSRRYSAALWGEGWTLRESTNVVGWLDSSWPTENHLTSRLPAADSWPPTASGRTLISTSLRNIKRVDKLCPTLYSISCHSTFFNGSPIRFCRPGPTTARCRRMPPLLRNDVPPRNHYIVRWHQHRDAYRPPNDGLHFRPNVLPHRPRPP